MRGWRRHGDGLEVETDIRRLAAGGSLNLVGGCLGAVANLAALVVVTRGLDKTSAGQFFTVTSAFLMAVAVSKLGSATGLVYFIAQFRVLGVPAGVVRSLRLGVLPVALVSSILGGAVFVWAPQITALLGGAHQPGTVLFLRQVALLLPFASVAEALQAATRGFDDMATTVVVDRVLRSSLQVLLLLGACALGGRYAALAWALPYLPAALLSAWLLRRLWGQGRTWYAAASDDGRPRRGEYWRFTTPRAVTDTLQVLLQRLDIVLVAVMLGPAQAAIYAAATRFLNLVVLVDQALTNVLEPRASALFAQRDTDGVQRLYQITTGWLIVLSWPICLLALAFPEMVLAPFGAGYEVGAPVVIPLAASMLFASACGMVDLVLGMSGRTGWNLVNVALALVVTVAVDLLLIPELGIRGAALGWAAALVTGRVLPLLEIHLLLRIHPFGRATWVAAALTVVAFGLAAMAARLIWGDSPIGLAAALIVATIGFLVGLRRAGGALMMSGPSRLSLAD